MVRGVVAGDFWVVFSPKLEVGISLFFFNTSSIDRHGKVLYCMKIISMLDLFEIMRRNLGLVV